MSVSWTKCQGDAWCPLKTVRLDHAHFDGLEGVFIVWHGGQKPATVLVGHGAIRERIAACRVDPSIQVFEPMGLYVTWTAVPPQQREGIQLHLMKRLSPKLGTPPVATEIAVNLPWG
jgi:hypothetical protein